MADSTFPNGIPAAEWSASAQGDNAGVTPTKAAEAGKRHYITSISLSFTTTAGKGATLAHGATTVRRYQVAQSLVEVFIPPLRCDVNTAAVLTLNASGTGGVIGAANMSGFTR